MADGMSSHDEDDAYLLRYASLMKPKRPAHHIDPERAPDAEDDQGNKVAADDVKGSTEVPKLELDAGLVEAWAQRDAHDFHIRQVLMSLTTNYDEDDFPNAQAVQVVLEQQQSLKLSIDEAFHQEMHQYHKGSISVVPSMLDLCDAMDDSVDDCRATSRQLDRCRLSVSNSVKLIGLRRRRDNMRRLRDACAAVATWTIKMETIVAKLQVRDFRTAIIMLGARMYSDNGSPKQLRDLSAITGAVAAPSSVPPPAPHDEAIATATTTPAKKPQRQRSATIAYMAHSHAPRPVLTATVESGSASPSGAQVRDMALADFIEGVGGVCAETVVGRTALAAFFELKEHGTELVVHTLKSELNHILTERFSPTKLFRVIDGLFALKVRGDSLSRFFLDCIAPVIGNAIRSGLADVVGEDAGATWEAIADTLVPSEFHDCAVQVLAKLASVLRSMLELQTYCSAIVKCEEGQSHKDTEAQEKYEICLTACRFLSTIGVQSLNKCLASVVLYAMQTKLSRGQLEDTLHVYRLLHCFVNMAVPVSPDGAAQSTKASLRYQCMRLIRDEYLHSFVDNVVNVMQSDMFLPWAATPDDFPSIFPYIPGGDDDNTMFQSYLDTSDVGEGIAPLQQVLAETTTAHDAPHVPIVNPFLVSPTMDSLYVPVVAASTTPLQLFDAVPLFTFTSSMVCKRMLEVARTVVQFGDAAAQLLDCVTYLASMYVWFVATHFVASTETIGLEADTNVPAAIRDFAKIIKGWTTFVPPPAGFPLFPNAPCHMWKSRAAIPAAHHAAQERTTAICSLESVVVCHRLIVCALTPLLPPDEMVPVANVSEALSAVSKYSIAHGLRRVALNILPPESVATSIERANLSAATTDGEMSSSFRSITDQLHQVHLKLRESHRDMPFVGAQKLLEHLVFIACCGVVEGVSRIRKLTDAGKAQLLRDAAAMCKLLSTLHPSIPLKLFDYVQSFVRAFCASFQDALTFVQNSHGWYTTRQLVAFGDKEGFMKKRDVEQLLSKLQHEDRLPLHLMES
ncbi:Hypothetical protein, putative [Bodo saltans]|uniref:Syndetin C-terminal domain-containing protein n=1 Tax=Bodo saltans TaxID=75058 RepID=A0A0S4IQ94_BODSA|nr:Hypothetical protein, putative [Bodo saltans]|eukprot:CUF14702.1 Hypothetical protein, putative [Bodo saltans]